MKTPSERIIVAATGLLVATMAVASCTSEDATPIDPDRPPVIDQPDISHPLAATDQMREAAEAQCLENSDLVEGYVRAVDPDTDEILSELTVDCAEIRG